MNGKLKMLENAAPYQKIQIHIFVNMPYAFGVNPRTWLVKVLEDSKDIVPKLQLKLRYNQFFDPLF